MGLPIALLSAVAPTIAKMIGTKLENVAQTKIKEALGVDIIPDAMSSEDLDKLKKAEDEMLLELYKLDVIDRDSARKLALNDNTPRVLAYLITFGFFGMLLVINFLPEANQSILNIMIGSLGTAWVSIVNYYFGSSLGSRNKNELLLKPK
ncbi:hypothetical protein KC946_03870 [Candidatus Saccharibacteria bacterium]|nr:hypothetical protein [Candidatus Saccharibacteria bacterium]